MIDQKILTINDFLAPLNKIIRGKAQDTLGDTLSLVHSSHSAVYIYNDKNEFLGLISPFRTIYSKNYPYTTLVSTILFKPPHLTRDSSIYEMAEQMLATKIYTLPVFNEDRELTNEIDGKEILKVVLRDSDLLNYIKEKLKRHSPITARVDSTANDIFHLMKEKKVSRVILIDDQGVLSGIVTRSDLMRTLIKSTLKMRFRTEGLPSQFSPFAGEKKFRKGETIRKYSTKIVESLPDFTPVEKVINHLINSPHKSIVLVDKNRKPTGFLSMRDILKEISNLKPEVDIPLIIKKPSRSVSKSDLEQAIELLSLFAKKINKKKEIQRIEVVTEEPKSPNGDTHVFNTTVIVVPREGNAIIANTKQRIFLDAIREAVIIIEKQRRRSPTQR